MWHIFLSVNTFHSVTRFSSKNHLSKCNPFFKVWLLWAPLIRLSAFGANNDKYVLIKKVWLIFQIVTQFSSYFVWPIFARVIFLPYVNHLPSVTDFFQLCHFFQTVTQFTKCDPFFYVWPIFLRVILLSSVTHFSKRDPFSNCDHFLNCDLFFSTVTYFLKCDAFFRC